MENGITAFIPVHIRNLLIPGETGEILLVSSSGIYLCICGQVLLICDQSWGVLPIGIGMENFESAVRLLRPQQGQPVTVWDDRLVFRGGSIHLVPQTLLCERVTHNHQPQIRYIRQAAEELAALHKERGISMLVLPLVLGSAADDTLKQNPYCAHGHTYLSRLMIALRQGDNCEIRGCVEKLLGLGPGLTPSADDVLLGMLYIFRALQQKSPEGVGMLQENIEQLCDRCTNQISAAYLKTILTGAPFQRMEQVLRGMCGDEQLDIQKLTQIGSSSGSEMLLGMLIALHVCGYDVSQKEEIQ